MVFTSPDIIKVVKGGDGWDQVEGKCSESFGLESSVDKLRSVDNIKMEFTGSCFKNL